MAVTWLLLILIAAAVVVGVVIATVLVGNRHTQGFGKAIGFFAALLVVGTVGMWFFAVAPRQVQVEEEVNRAQRMHLREIAEQQAAHFNQLAEGFEQQQGEDAQAVAQQYRQQALQYLAEYPPVSPDPPAAAGFGVMRIETLSLVSPVVVILFLGGVLMVFKYFGPGVGFASLAVPLVVAFFGLSHTARQSEETALRARYSDEAHQFSKIDPLRSVPISAAPVAETRSELPEGSLFTVSEADQADDELADDESSDAAANNQPADDLPDWVRQPPKSVENVYRVVVDSSWRGDQAACEREAQQAAKLVVQSYLTELAIEENGGPTYLPKLEQLGITSRYIRENFYSRSDPPYLETRDFEHQQDMKNLHVLLEFDHADTQDLLARWRRYERQLRVGGVAAVLGGILATLAGALGLIKLDTYTKGYYTKRLFIGVPLAIIGVGILLAIVA